MILYYLSSFSVIIGIATLQEDLTQSQCDIMQATSAVRQATSDPTATSAAPEPPLVSLVNPLLGSGQGHTDVTQNGVIPEPPTDGAGSDTNRHRFLLIWMVIMAACVAAAALFVGRQHRHSFAVDEATARRYRVRSLP